MADGEVRVTVGDLDAAPREKGARRIVDYREPASPAECGRVRYVPVRGWWCKTAVKGLRVSDDIVVNASRPTARIQANGFVTRCANRPGRMRQRFLIERDSWSGWRVYGSWRVTEWTRDQTQRMGNVTEGCPMGRVGTYDHRLSVRLELDEAPVGETYAASADIRTHCGTGAS
ncbi:MAG: hypothetical protein FWJ90_12940 [Actinomadura sp.]